MALKEADRKWIREEIGRSRGPSSSARSDARPWYDRHAGLIALLGVAAAVATLWYVVRPSIERDMRNDLRADINAGIESRGLAPLPQDVAAIQATLSTIQPILNDLIREQLHKAADLSPSDLVPELPYIKHVVSAASRAKVKVPIEDVKSIGRTGIMTAASGGASAAPAWGLVLRLISYRSVLNVEYTVRGPLAPLPAGHRWRYGINNVEGKPPPAMRFTPGAGVPSGEAAECDLIGANKNAGLRVGPAALVLTGGAADLDRMRIRNAVFQDVEVHYNGRRVILQNVVFIDCRFVISNDAPGRRLGHELLAAAKVSFKNEP